jgi:hypothetical protein
MKKETTCLRCGSTDLGTGWVQSTGKVSFRPDDAKFLTYRFADINVGSRMCYECGNIELIGDVKKARSLVKKFEESTDTVATPV